MNKPFEVCLRSVLPPPAEALAEADEAIARFALAEASANKGKGRLQTGIEAIRLAKSYGE